MVLLDTEQPAGLSSDSESFLAARHLPGFGPGLGWALARSRVRRCRSCSAARSPIRACWTGSSTSSSCGPSTGTPHAEMRPCGCCAVSTPSTSATSPTCTRASTPPFSSSGVPRTRSSRCGGPSRWSRPSLVPRSRSCGPDLARRPDRPGPRLPPHRPVRASYRSDRARPRVSCHSEPAGRDLPESCSLLAASRPGGSTMPSVCREAWSAATVCCPRPGGGPDGHRRDRTRTLRTCGRPDLRGERGGAGDRLLAAPRGPPRHGRGAVTPAAQDRRARGRPVHPRHGRHRADGRARGGPGPRHGHRADDRPARAQPAARSRST